MLSEEIAVEEFKKFEDHYGIFPGDMAEEEKRAYSSAKKRIIRAIMSDYVEIHDNGHITQRLYHPPGSIESIEYGELSGRSKTAMGSYGPNDYNNRVYALLGSLSGLGYDAILALKGRDLSLAECLGVAFLSV